MDYSEEENYNMIQPNDETYEELEVFFGPITDKEKANCLDLEDTVILDESSAAETSIVVENQDSFHTELNTDQINLKSSSHNFSKEINNVKIPSMNNDCEDILLTKITNTPDTPLVPDQELYSPPEVKIYNSDGTLISTLSKQMNNLDMIKSKENCESREKSISFSKFNFNVSENYESSYAKSLSIKDHEFTDFLIHEENHKSSDEIHNSPVLCSNERRSLHNSFETAVGKDVPVTPTKEGTSGFNKRKLFSEFDDYQIQLDAMDSQKDRNDLSSSIQSLIISKSHDSLSIEDMLSKPASEEDTLFNNSNCIPTHSPCSENKSAPFNLKNDPEDEKFEEESLQGGSISDDSNFALDESTPTLDGYKKDFPQDELSDSGFNKSPHFTSDRSSELYKLEISNSNNSYCNSLNDTLEEIERVLNLKEDDLEDHEVSTSNVISDLDLSKEINKSIQQDKSSQPDLSLVDKENCLQRNLQQNIHEKLSEAIPLNPHLKTPLPSPSVNRTPIQDKNSKLPRLTTTQAPVRTAFAMKNPHQPNVFFTPLPPKRPMTEKVHFYSAKKPSKLVPVSGLNIVSPVAQCLRNNPPPPLIATVKPKYRISPIKMQDDAASLKNSKYDHKTNFSTAYKGTGRMIKVTKALPSHQYTAGKALQLENKENCPTRGFSPSTVVLKHKGRIPVPKAQGMNSNSAISSEIDPNHSPNMTDACMEISLHESHAIQHTNTLKKA